MKKYFLFVGIILLHLSDASGQSDSSRNDSMIIDSVDHMPKHHIVFSAFPDIIANINIFTFSFTAAYSGDLSKRLTVNAMINREIFTELAGPMRIYSGGFSFYPIVKRKYEAEFTHNSTKYAGRSGNTEYYVQDLEIVSAPQFVKYGLSINYRHQILNLEKAGDRHLSFGDPNNPNGSFLTNGYVLYDLYNQDCISFGFAFQRNRYYTWYNDENQKEHYMKRYNWGLEFVQIIRSGVRDIEISQFKDSNGSYQYQVPQDKPIYIELNGGYKLLNQKNLETYQQGFGWRLYAQGLVSFWYLKKFSFSYRGEIFVPKIGWDNHSVSFALGFAYSL